MVSSPATSKHTGTYRWYNNSACMSTNNRAVEEFGSQLTLIVGRYATNEIN